MELRYVLALAALLVVGCIPQPGYYQPQPINMTAGYRVPNTGGQPGNVTYANPPTAGVPYGSMVVTRFGGIIPRYAPIPNHYMDSSPQAAVVRQAGESIAQSDYAGVAQAAPEIPQNQQGGGGPTGQQPTQQGGGTTTTVQAQINVLAGQQVQTNQRLRRVESIHGINPTH